MRILKLFQNAIFWDALNILYIEHILIGTGLYLFHIMQKINAANILNICRTYRDPHKFRKFRLRN